MTIDRAMDGERLRRAVSRGVCLTAHGMADEGMTGRPYGRGTV